MTSSDYSPVGPLPSLLQEYTKIGLAKAFISQEIVTVIEIDWYGRVKIKKQSWESYWDIEDNLPERNSFLCFEKARNMYIASGFEPNYLGEYCYRYFVLLSKWLALRNKPFVQRLLVKLLSLENFAIRWHDQKSGTAAGTTSHRNPAYLLARIGKKSFNEDPKYLPLIMLNNSSNNEIFYHYRQYKIFSNPDFSIFVYPAVNLDNRNESFTLIESFAAGFTRRADPRSKQRA
ncbi:MAG: hypothetical protein PHQ00_07665, partial [Phycisphaerae bacterium]|nr:hypothetical protein [Phycisphaerae bacterium]